MVRFFRYHISAISRKKLAVLLALCWCAGIVLGLYCALTADNFPVSLMRTSVESCASITGLLAVLSLPVLFSAFAVYVSQLWLLVPVSFFKAFSFSFVGTLSFLTPESGGWLLRFLYLFSDCFAVLILCWLWLHCCQCSRRNGLISCAVTGIFLLMIGIADHWYVSPFLINLLT